MANGQQVDGYLPCEAGFVYHPVLKEFGNDFKIEM
jgi:hypothetical protein